MESGMRRLPLLTAWIAAVLAVAAIGGGTVGATGAKALLPVADQAKGGDRPLFIIERSKNANVVHYDARLTPEGKFDPDQPVVAYWILLAEKGQRDFTETSSRF